MTTGTDCAGELLALTERLRERVGKLRFAEPVTHVYNPLDYARETTARYLERFAPRDCKHLFLGMNPGPWGMAQTGVPFGEVGIVRDWMKLRGAVEKPAREHPKRPVLGLDCPRSEVSGARLWGWVAERFGTPARFARRNFVWNWCPLSFMEESGRNRTPDKLAADERKRLEGICDAALAEAVAILRPDVLVGVGKFAAKRAGLALKDRDLRIVDIPHPSPASPAANRGWAALVERRIEELDLDLGFRT